MPETVVGGISRFRKIGAGKITVTAGLIKRIQGLAPEWDNLPPKKILDMIDRALPCSPADHHSMAFSLPGGKQTVLIPVAIQKDEIDFSRTVALHDKKPIKIKDN